VAERVCKGTHQVRGKREILGYGPGGGPGSILAAIERGCDARGSVAGVLDGRILRQMELTTRQLSPRSRNRTKYEGEGR